MSRLVKKIPENYHPVKTTTILGVSCSWVIMNFRRQKALRNLRLSRKLFFQLIASFPTQLVTASSHNVWGPQNHSGTPSSVDMIGSDSQQAPYLESPIKEMKRSLFLGLKRRNQHTPNVSVLINIMFLLDVTWTPQRHRMTRPRTKSRR